MGYFISLPPQALIERFFNRSEGYTWITGELGSVTQRLTLF